MRLLAFLTDPFSIPGVLSRAPREAWSGESPAGQSVSAYVLSRALPAERERLAEILAALRAGADRRSALA